MNEGTRGCFKYGCIGCVTVFAVCLGLIFLLAAIQLNVDHEPEPVETRAEQSLPAPPAPPSPPAAEAPHAPGDVPPTIEIAPSGELPGSAPAPGVLVLDLSMGEFEIRPGPAGQPLRVDADYDAGLFELAEEFTETDGGWTYEVSFGGRGGLLGMILRGGGNNARNRVEITVPRGHPIRIVGEIGMGESKIDLGGLWVREVDLELGAGDHFLDFREPLPFPMESFRLDSSMGGVEVRSLGQASPSQVVLKHGMGDLFVDLQGPWRNDSVVKARFSMGQCRIWMPENARVEISRSTMAMGEVRADDVPDPDSLPPGAPTIRIEAEGSMGELRIER